MSTSFFQTEMVNRVWTFLLKIKLISYVFLSQSLKNPNLYSMTVLNCLVTSSANLYFYCFAGSVTTNNLLLFSDALFESNWFKMPNYLQKYFIIMIAEAQRSHFLDGFGLIRLSLEAFTKVMRRIQIRLQHLFESEFISFFLDVTGRFQLLPDV